MLTLLLLTPWVESGGQPLTTTGSHASPLGEIYERASALTNLSLDGVLTFESPQDRSSIFPTHQFKDPALSLSLHLYFKRPATFSLIFSDSAPFQQWRSDGRIVEILQGEGEAPQPLEQPGGVIFHNPLFFLYPFWALPHNQTENLQLIREEEVKGEPCLRYTVQSAEKNVDLWVRRGGTEVMKAASTLQGGHFECFYDRYARVGSATAPTEIRVYRYGLSEGPLSTGQTTATRQSLEGPLFTFQIREIQFNLPESSLAFYDIFRETAPATQSQSEEKRLTPIREHLPEKVRFPWRPLVAGAVAAAAAGALVFALLRPLFPASKGVYLVEQADGQMALALAKVRIPLKGSWSTDKEGWLDSLPAKAPVIVTGAGIEQLGSEEMRRFVQNGGRLLLLTLTRRGEKAFPLKISFLPVPPSDPDLVCQVNNQGFLRKVSAGDLSAEDPQIRPVNLILRMSGMIPVVEGLHKRQTETVIGILPEGGGIYLFCQYRLLEAILKGNRLARRLLLDLVHYLSG